MLTSKVMLKLNLVEAVDLPSNGELELWSAEIIPIPTFMDYSLCVEISLLSSNCSTSHYKAARTHVRPYHVTHMHSPLP